MLSKAYVGVAVLPAKVLLSNFVQGQSQAVNHKYMNVVSVVFCYL
jgi:hypothetical protein